MRTSDPPAGHIIPEHTGSCRVTSRRAVRKPVPRPAGIHISDKTHSCRARSRNRLRFSGSSAPCTCAGEACQPSRAILWVNAIRMTVVPLVASLLIIRVASSSNISAVRGIGGQCSRNYEGAKRPPVQRVGGGHRSDKPNPGGERWRNASAGGVRACFWLGAAQGNREPTRRSRDLFSGCRRCHAHHCPRDHRARSRSAQKSSLRNSSRGNSLGIYRESMPAIAPGWPQDTLLSAHWGNPLSDEFN